MRGWFVEQVWDDRFFRTWLLANLGLGAVLVWLAARFDVWWLLTPAWIAGAKLLQRVMQTVERWDVQLHTNPAYRNVSGQEQR